MIARFRHECASRHSGLRASHARRLLPVSLFSLALAVANLASHAQNAPPAPPQSATSETGNVGLADLDAMTFDCVKAGLNAAAREAAKVHTQGTYQFDYFRLLNDSHHSAYEVHFKSNYPGEPELRYCVAIYCQEVWDPKSTRPSVSLIGNDRRTAATAPANDCAHMHAPAKHY